MPTVLKIVPKPIKVEHLPGGKQLWYFRDRYETLVYYNSVKHAVLCTFVNIGNTYAIVF